MGGKGGRAEDPRALTRIDTSTNILLIFCEALPDRNDSCTIASIVFFVFVHDLHAPPRLPHVWDPTLGSEGEGPPKVVEGGEGSSLEVRGSAEIVAQENWFIGEGAWLASFEPTRWTSQIQGGRGLSWPPS